MADVLDRPHVKFIRWIATVHYRTESGLVDVQHDLEELDELQDLVERPLTIAEQISAIGNSVCPPVARALVTANQPGIVGMRLAA